MDNRTMGIIYALKQCKYSSDVAIRMFMSEYSGTNWNKMGREAVDNLLRQTCAEFINEADNPVMEIRRYFNGYSSVFCNTEFEMMINFLQQTRVRDANDNYINGFTDNPFKNYACFKNEEE